VQERLIPFMNSYGFRVSAAEEFMYSQPVQATALPLQRFEAIQVVDQRLNKEKVSTDMYMGWLAEHRFPTSDGLIELPFVPVEVDKINPNKPLLVILDAGASAFGYDEDTKALNLLSAQGIVDPYVALYKSIPQVVKQSLNVNYNKTEDFIVATDYLHYHIPVSSLRPKTKAYWKATVEERLTADRLSSLKRNLEVCLTELWLKWVIAGKAECSKENSCLPYLSRLSDEWGFVTDNLLLYFEHSNIVFADLATPEGKKILKGRFTAWSEIKKHFMKRTLKDEEKAEQALPNVHFVLIGKNVLEIECTKTMAMPNWPIIKAIKAQDASKSARSREAIGVYAGGIWYNGETNRYIVSGTESSAGKEERGHHLYQIHQYGPVEKSNLSTLISLLTVTFVRKNRFTVFPYPFDLLRLHRELIAQSS
jgi:hypothetical protein